MYIKKVLFFIAVLLTANSARADDNIFRISFDQAYANIDSSTQTGDQANQFFQVTDGSTTLQGLTLQWDFSRHFGVFYRQLQASDVPVNQFGTAATTGTESISGKDIGLEARYPVADWVDVLARVNIANIYVDTTENDNLNLGMNFHNESGQTYFSVGARAKITQHFGVEAIYDDYSSIFGNAISLGIYLQF